MLKRPHYISLERVLSGAMMTIGDPAAVSRIAKEIKNWNVRRSLIPSPCPLQQKASPHPNLVICAVEIILHISLRNDIVLASSTSPKLGNNIRFQLERSLIRCRTLDFFCIRTLLIDSPWLMTTSTIGPCKCIYSTCQRFVGYECGWSPHSNWRIWS